MARSPVELRISQSTPAGVNPAIRARSIDASVCPARRKTPPSIAKSGKTCPGLTKSFDTVVSLANRRIVSDRSAAVIPVLQPAKSTGVKKAVDSGEVFVSTIGRKSKRWAAAGRIEQHSWPWPASMKLTSSGVIRSAAQTKSPSFSRSSSSSTITTLPAAIASTAAWIVLNRSVIPDLS